MINQTYYDMLKQAKQAVQNSIDSMKYKNDVHTLKQILIHTIKTNTNSISKFFQ